MKFRTIIAAVALCFAGSASAAVLTFDNLTNFMYGDGYRWRPAWPTAART